MKIKLTFLILFISIVSFAQVGVGYRLDKIQEEDKDGILKADEDFKGWTYVYDNQDISSLFVYFLTNDYYCYGVAVKPHDKETTQVWVRNLDKNKDWIKLKRKHWIMFLNKDYATDCFQTKDDEGNDLFLFKLKQR